MSFKPRNKTYGDYGLPTYGAIGNRNLKFVNARINQQKHPTVSLKQIIDPRIDPIIGTKMGTKMGNSNYGKIWYPHMNIDLNYNPNIGGYVNANGPIGPYFAQGLGNYPRSMYKQLYFGTHGPGTLERSRSPEKIRQGYVYYISMDDDVYGMSMMNELEQILNNPNVKKGDKIVTTRRGNSIQFAKIFYDKNRVPKLTQWRDVPKNNFGKYRRSKKIVYCLPKEKKFPVNTKKKCSAALSYARYAPDPCKIARCVQRNCKKYPTVGTYSKLIKECDAKKRRKSKK